MAFDIQAAKDAGYTDDEINAYLQAKPKSQTIAPVAPGSEVDPGEPPPPPSPEGFAQAGEGNFLPAIGTAAAVAAPYVVPAAVAGLGLYGAAKVGSFGRDLLNTGREVADAYKTGVGQNAATQEFRALERMSRVQGPEGDMARQRLQQLIRAQSGLPQVTTPPPAQAGSQAFNQMGQQLSQARPVNPATMAPPAAAPAPQAPRPSMMQRGTDIANQMRQFAAQRVIPVMGQAGQMAGRGLAAVANSPVTRVGGMAANAMYSGDLNANEMAELERRRRMAPTISGNQ